MSGPVHGRGEARPSYYKVRQLGTGWKRLWLTCSAKEAFLQALENNEQIRALSVDSADFDNFWEGSRYAVYHEAEEDQPVFQIEPVECND